MLDSLTELSCARLPVVALPALAEVRCHAGVQAARDGDQVWLRWEPGDRAVIYRVLPVSGAVLYTERDGRWYRQGSRLPAFDFPAHLDYRPLHQVLLPAPVLPLAAPAPKLQRRLVTLVPDHRPRPATALIGELTELAAWADTVPTARLGGMEAACSKGRVLLRGTRLPLLPRSERFWGDRLLVPLGQRLTPELSACALADALALADDELLLLHLSGSGEIVSRASLQPLTRAGIRLALQEGGR
jgi:hypothetical protein